MTRPLFQKVRGMHDILQDGTPTWLAVESTYRQVMEIYGYSQVRIPVVEQTGLFRRSIGDDTDIVGKEMYSFVDAGDEELTLRPEGTAGAVRAYVEHSIFAAEPVTKWWYVGPMFRRERPQKGRYRQFHQTGAEVFGSPPPFADAELGTMLADFFGRVGLEDPVLVYNHLGGDETRERYRAVLRSWYGGRQDTLCEDCRRRLATNPLRLLDCKVAGCAALKEQAPDIRQSLCDADRESLSRYAGLLASSGVGSRHEPRLVRGLDYYTGIVFEVEVATQDGPMVVAGGGRYDGLVEKLGGPRTPAAGYAIGLERLVECVAHVPPAGLDLFVLIPDPAVEALGMKLLDRARRAGIRADADPRAGSFKSQMKRADKVMAAVVVILGADEIARGAVALRDMRSGSQWEVPLDSVVDKVAGRRAR